MVRIAFLMSLLGLLAAAPATARPAAPAWWFWLRKPETHGSRKMAGDYKPVYTTYRYHSREKQGLLSFLRAHRPAEAPARHHQRPAGASPRRPRHMSW